jgi:hypothetical protein
MENDAGSSQQSTDGWQGRHRERRAAVLQGAARHAARRANGLVAISSRLLYGLATILPMQAIIDSSYGSRSDRSKHMASMQGDGVALRVVVFLRLPLKTLTRPPPADRWPDHVRLSDFELQFVCKGGKRGADVRPYFTGRRKPARLPDRVAKISVFKCGKLHKRS